MKHPVIVSDRRWLLVAGLAAVTVAAAGLLAARRSGMPEAAGLLGGAVAGALAVLGLPSLPTRLATVLVVGLSGVMVAHHSGLAATDSGLVLVWALAFVVTLVVADHVDHDRLPALDGTASPPARSVLGAARTAVVIAVAVGVAALLLAPIVQEHVRPDVVPGATPTLDGLADAPASLRVNDRLDMSSAPRLSDAVVLRIDADRPDFWRSEVFDVWDGAGWSRSDTRAFRASAGRGGAALEPEPYALPAGGTRWRQTVRVEVEYAEVIVGAPTVVAVDTDRPVVQRPDGTAGVIVPFGKGATYTVTSVRVPATEAALRAADAERAPPDVVTRYAAPPVISPRVAALAEAAAAGARSTYDTVRALEAMLAQRVEYSIEAPISPHGVDVVDHFLFESRLGWCQQVSTSLAVMLRHLGIPARVAVGFVPGEYDPLAHEYVVRERDAHQWVEVYFPGVGWQGFDPTAAVPLAGEPARAPSAAGWLARNATGIVLLALAGAALGLAGVLGRRALLLRRRRRLESPLARRYRRLVSLGRRAHRGPGASETLVEYGAALAAAIGDDRARSVARALDRAQFGAGPPAEADLAALDADLAALDDLARSRRRPGDARVRAGGLVGSRRP